MTVKKHKNGKWYCKFTIRGVTKHLLCAGATTPDEAEEIETAFKFRLQQQMNGVIPKELKNVYFSRLKQLYIKHAKTHHKKYKNQIYYLNILEKYFSNGKPVNKIKPEDIQRFIAYLRTERNLKNSSINRYLEMLSKMFNLAIDNGELNYNPLSKVKELHEDNYRDRVLDSNEEDRLFKSINIVAPYLRPIVITALETGMRRGEIFGMKWCNIDINNRIIYVLDSKSGKSREIPVSDKLLNLLNTLSKKSEYVFFNPDTNKPYVDIKKSFAKVLKQAHIDKFRFHDLRHTFATRLVAIGVDLVVVKEILGHSNIQTTMRYSHADNERKQQAVNKLSSYKD